ncbi:MAG: AI-2E family transporter [Candidatus Magasanikbacteria bacterium CG11_big_fil_rev_8_21_14_0_20_39_34]|uniref:AI-2E family transporter n=1 Tax=Candidatus Magasanikbacteria bacterium CG11_big_fil_rev_8_21_14_0_20_39_34 TaxID=1974653 RepID=A0A2H0N6F6_9BACT|nr:MAG: AI-2E family transporter [Candidatus Magasanikbacteria bacterium CG11_big_fil_rev_8_21_14_0_20_39_34]
MPPKETKANFNNIRMIFFFGIMLLLGTIFLYIVAPFFYPIFWAAIIAVMFFPLFRWIHKYIKIDALSSFVTILIIIVVLFLPLLLVTTLTVHQSANLYSAVKQNQLFTGNLDQVSQHFSKIPFIGEYTDTIKYQWTENAGKMTQVITQFLYTHLVQFTQNSVRFFFMLFIMLYTLFYLLKDGPRILQKLMYLSPLGDTYEKKLFDRFTSTTRATLKSTFIVGSIQGILGGLLFWVTGIPGALVWGVVMTALSVIPAIGSFLVWLPAGIIMMAMGNIAQGLTIIIFGSFVIGTIDNILRPPLIGKDIQMHPLIVLFSTLGGIFIFGISGFIIGPIIAALFISVMSIYKDYYKNELSNN